MKAETYRNLTTGALDRLRIQIFGDESLKLFQITPETGEAEVAELTQNWGGRRLVATTEAGRAEAGAWQFQVKANDDWQTSQTYMSQVVSLRIGGRRWKVKKIETPVGNVRVWKIKAEIQ
jgi:hypothetical protein